MSTPRAWHATAVALGLYAVWLLVVYHDTVASMVSIWYRSETFAHGFLVVPISAWLVWRQRARLAELEPQPAVSPWASALMLLAGMLWLAGELADVLAARHFAWVTFLVGGVWMLTGPAVVRLLLFPLAFLYFAVPVGEFLLPTLIEWTATFTVAALRATGIPVWREGSTFQIPSGSWSVVEACGGLRYLIASVTVGVLYAYLAYRSALRRSLFIAASVIVPIVANWLRAYMIVMIGHLSGNKLAVGVDHIIYGWIFFGVVMLLLFWLGSLWREDALPGDESVAVSRTAVPSRAPARRLGKALVATLLLTAIMPAATAALDGGQRHGRLDASAPRLGDWRPVEGSLVEWVPDFMPPRATIASSYTRGGERAGAYIAVYYGQDGNSKLVSSANQLIRTGPVGWVISERLRDLEDANGLSVNEAVVRVRDQRVLVRSWYWIDGEYTASPARAKFAQFKERLFGRGDAGAIIVVYAVVPSEGPAHSDALDGFTRDAAEALSVVLPARLQALATQ